MRNVCGFDVHKDSVFMCILKENGEKFEAKFGVLTPELDRLCDLLVFHSVGEIAMENTAPISEIALLYRFECLINYSPNVG